MDELLNALKRHVGAMIDRVGQPRWGVVSGVDPSRPAVKVFLQPENVETGWLPMVQQSAASGWGVYTVPTPGMTAFVVPDNGVAGHWVVTGFAHNDGALPPKVSNTIGSLGTPSTAKVQGVGGETLLVHQSGSVIRLCADGSILLRGNVNIDGSLHVNGNILAELDISDKAGAHHTMANLRDAYNAHVHTQGNDSHGDTEVPTNTTSLPVT